MEKGLNVECEMWNRCSVKWGKGVRNLLPERPEGCFAQKVPDPNGTVVRKVWFGHELRYRCD